MPISSVRIVASRIAAITIALAATNVAAEPFIPKNDQEILDRAPTRLGAPAAREARNAQAVLKANPRNLDLALRIAQLHIRRARTESDPRHLGQAEAALAPWWNLQNPPVPVLVLRATIRQSLHDFAHARADLEQVVARDANNAQAWLTLATVQHVTGDYTHARASCAQLRGRATVPVQAACVAAIDGAEGKAQQGFNLLQKAIHDSRGLSREMRAWILTLQAELAERASQPKTAERLYRQALILDRRDAYATAAYADFLLDQRRPREVLKLIPADAATDVLMLRRVLAGHTVNAKEAAREADALAARYAAARSRGDRVHLREEARFLLHVRGDADAAFALATENWRTQKEPADVRILLESANAVGARAGADEALAWLERTRLEGRMIARLADEARRL